MADDYTLRPNRSNDPYRRAAEPARASEHAGGSDPLAELARLIGQDDPFADRNAPRAAQRPINPPPPAASDWQQAPEPHRYPSRDIYGASGNYADPPARHEPYAESQYDDMRADAPGQAQSYDAPAHDAAQGHEQDYDRAHYHADQAAIDPHEDDMYDDAPGSRRRGGLVTVLALIGCAMMGTAGAYGYRSYYADTGAKEPPPVIAADTNTPSKIVPAGDPKANPQPNKLISERFANAAAGKEQIVSRQEEPVALKEPGTPSAPRVVLPSPVAPAPSVAPAQAAAPPQATPPAPLAAVAPPAALAPPPGGSGGPKRVRTVTIRPDGSDASGRPVGAAPAHGAAVAPAPRTTPPAPRAAAPSRQHNGPLSLDPQGQPIETGTAPAQPRVRSAVNAPAPRAAPEPAEPSAGGNYVVQISSQTNERDAQASFRSLQAKFPNELGGRQPIIRRADLGAKGVVYRTNVGPFASHQEAAQFCAGYRAAGGQCVVPRN